jgi:GNAT superfamily N-acetyltransferase
MTGEPGFEVDTDLARIDLDLVHRWLSTDAFWAIGRTRETVQRAAEGSLNFAAFEPDGVQCAYARVVTDGATFAWLCDVYVDRDFRGRGVGLLLSRAVVDRLAPLHLTRVMLSTTDAHGLYERVGFTPFPYPDRLMVLSNPELPAG